jgi:hypothetical protein
MSTLLASPTDQGQSSTAVDDEILQYRALYSGALVAMLLGILSIAVPLTSGSLSSALSLTPIPLVGAFIGYRAWRTISRNPQMYTGGPLALAGMTLSLVFLLGGVSYAGYVYATEVPTGYTRTSFFQFRPDRSEERAGKPIPDDVVALAGQPVFIKGYIRPDSVTHTRDIDQFLLVRDDNQCCFGDISQVKFYDQMFVKFVGDLRIDDRRSLVRVGGKLSIYPQNLGGGADQVVYVLEADYVK